MATIALQHVAKSFGSAPAVEDVTLDVREGEFLTLLGPSGCGKTTALRLVAGFARPTRGRILIGGEDVTALPPRKRNIGMVFQDYALFPHLSVAENIAFGLRERGAGKATIRRRTGELLALVQLSKVETRLPAELSGGQQQRVAMARALAYAPQVLLMDEPLGALDLKLREAMQIELHRVQRELRITTLYVTHDQEEAMSLSDRIAVMQAGRIIQVGTPIELYSRPLNPFVAHFVGKMNFLDGRVRSRHDDRCVIEMEGGLTFGTAATPELGVGASVQVAIRPERLGVRLAGADCEKPRLSGTVERRRFMGNVSQCFVRIGTGRLLLTESSGTPDGIDVGDRVFLEWLTEDALVFPQPLDAGHRRDS